MARAGTLPDYVYQKAIQIEEKFSLQASNKKTEETPHQDEDEEQHHYTVEDEMTQSDSSSHKESCADEALVEDESDLENLQITQDVDFFMDPRYRYGQSDMHNNRLIFLKESLK